MVMLTVRVPVVVREQLDAIAARTGRDRSELHRRMLADGIRRATGGALLPPPSGEHPTADQAP